MPRTSPDRSTSIAGEHGPVIHAIGRLARANRTLAGSLLRPIGLFPGQELVMMQLWERDRRSQTDLVTSLGLDPSTMTKMLQRMEKAGWIERARDEQDHRVIVISLTRSGQQLRPKVEKVWRAIEEATTESLSERQRDQLRSLLRRVESHVLERERSGTATGEA